MICLRCGKYQNGDGELDRELGLCACGSHAGSVDALDAEAAMRGDVIEPPNPRFDDPAVRRELLRNPERFCEFTGG